MSEIILSICIPTYNRGIYLNSSLQSIFKQIEGNKLVEVIVSDNQSTDDTHNIIQPYLKYDNFTYNQQQINVGMSKNIMHVVSLAKGEFCWLVGDDDFIIQGVIDELVRLIQTNKDIDFYYATPTGLPLDEYKSFSGVYDTTNYTKTNILPPLSIEILPNWERLISPKYSIIFMGELMAGIFRTNVWRSYRLVPEGEFLSNLESSYVFCVVYANTFFGKKAAYISTPLILALDGAREWMDRLGYILIVQVKNLLDLYKEKGLDKKILRTCYLAYIKMTLPHFFRYIFKGSDYKDKIPLKKYLAFLSANSGLTFKATFFILKGSIKKLLSSLILNVSPSFHKRLKATINR